jgi:DNA-binding NtrC family response regulator
MMPIIIDRVLNLLDWKRATTSPIAKEELQHLLPLLHDQDAQAIIDAYPVIPIDREFAILSIEDEPLQRENIIDFIEMKYSGTAVGTFSEGLELLQNETFDVVLLDINLPDFYGNHAVSLIKTFSPTTDIIMVTAYRSYELIQEAIRNGAADYIVKPFCFDRVQLAIAHIMQRRALRALIQDRISQPTAGDLS